MPGPLMRSLAVLAIASVLLAGCTDIIQPGPKPAGAKHEAFLTGGGVLRVEIDHAPGSQPPQKALDGFRSELSRITKKTVELTVNQDIQDRGDGYVYSVEELRQLDQDTQDEEDRAGVVVMHALFVDGRIENDRVAGLAFIDDAFAIAMGTVRENTCKEGTLLCSKPATWCAVRAVSIHEAGHLFGLVDNGLPMVQDHEMDEDPHPETSRNEGKFHSTNDASVMWWQVQLGPQLLKLFGDGCEDIPWKFDSDDMRDAEALRS